MPLFALIATSSAALHGLTPWGMFIRSDTVVKAVMAILIAASIATWTILVVKVRELRRERSCLREASNVLADVNWLAEARSSLVMQSGTPRLFLGVVTAEIELAEALPSSERLQERVASRFERLELSHSRGFRFGIGALATIGATAPFVGLFGTVWGIMNSFIGIAGANTTSLAVVAPGIAEALLATGLGLVAAIPAVIIYNYLTRSLMSLRGDLGDISAVLQQLVSRELDRAG